MGDEDEKLCVIQYDDRDSLPEHLEYLMKVNESLAKRGNFTYIRKPAINLPPYWAKVKVVQEEMEKNECDIVYWVDTDAALRSEDPSRLINLFEGKSMVISGDMPAPSDMLPWISTFNAGVWGVRNTKEGKRLVDSWMKLYPEENWSKHNGKWRCFEYGRGVRHCNWAEEFYEQGAFKRIMKKYPQDIQVVDYTAINNPECTDEDSVVVNHFANEYRKNIKCFSANGEPSFTEYMMKREWPGAIEI